MSLSPRFPCLLALAGLMVGLMLGCGQGGRKPVYRVHGRVVDAKNLPAAGALLIFHPIDGVHKESTKPLGYVEENGSFSLTTYSKNDGAPEGEYVITIEWHPANSHPFAGKQGPDKLAGRYSNPETSTIRFKVEKKEDNEVQTIQLH